MERAQIEQKPDARDAVISRPLGGRVEEAAEEGHVAAGDAQGGLGGREGDQQGKRDASEAHAPEL